LIESYVAQNKIIKTIESPRDLLVDEQVVQYSFSYAPHSEIRDILLLSRPDIAVYDEVRNQEDFVLFKDLRLTGIGLIGVIHATAPVDSVQRFIGTIEMGIIPQVIDTVIYIDK
jgi:ATPase